MNDCKEMIVKIKKIGILLSDGTDKVFIETCFGSPLPKITNQNLALNFDAEKNTGIDYCRKFFPNVEIEVINSPSKNYKFSK